MGVDLNQFPADPSLVKNPYSSEGDSKDTMKTTQKDSCSKRQTETQTMQYLWQTDTVGCV